MGRKRKNKKVQKPQQAQLSRRTPEELEGVEAMDKFFNSAVEDRLLYTSSGYREMPIGKDLDTIEKLALSLPDVDYILDSIVYYMFTNRLTTKDEEKDKLLHKFLQDTNFNGQRNIDVLQGVAKGYRKYGYYGIYDSGQGLVGIHPKDILAINIPYPEHPVLRQTLSYVIKRTDDAHAIVDRITGYSKGYSAMDIEAYMDLLQNPEKYKDDLLLVTEDNFACVKLDTSKVFGISPLLKDRKRVQLLLNILDRMNYDIARNGIGTIALQAKDSIIDSIEEGEAEGFVPSAGQLLDMGRTAKKERADKIAKDMEDISQKLSETEYNDAIVYSSKFENLLQLTRDTKAVDFLDYLSLYASSIVAQMFGVPARLFDLGKTVSNIGTHSIIDNSMKNNIIPMRTHFIGQCSRLIENAVGLNHHEQDITFASYEFSKDYNYSNDMTILEVYDRLKEIDPEKAEAYLDKNLII